MRPADTIVGAIERMADAGRPADIRDLELRVPLETFLRLVRELGGDTYPPVVEVKVMSCNGFTIVRPLE